jgi:predicted DNA-binding ribbon-helix-helix protein
MQSGVRKRSVLIDRHKTSISLEDSFWSALQEIARQRNVKMSHLLGEIDRQRAPGNPSSALRVFVLQNYRALGRGGLPNAAGGEPLLRPLSDGTTVLLAAGG